MGPQCGRSAARYALLYRATLLLNISSLTYAAPSRSIASLNCGRHAQLGRADQISWVGSDAATFDGQRAPLCQVQTQRWHYDIDADTSLVPKWKGQAVSSSPLSQRSHQITAQAQRVSTQASDTFALAAPRSQTAHFAHV